MSTARLALFVLFAAITGSAHAQTASRDLGGLWTLRAPHAGIGPVPATVPGSVHRALVAAGRLADPLVGAGEAAAAWVDTTTWVFETTFPGADPATGRAPVRPVLVFEGLDTFADIDLNGARVAASASMFVPLEVDVSGALVPGDNRLRVTFHPALREAARRAAAHPFALPESPRVFARKAQYSFGWDWGPRLVGAGLWRGVRLDDADAVRIEAVAAQTLRLHGAVRPDGTADADVRLSVDVAAGRRGVASVGFTLDGERVATRARVRLSGTRQTVTADVRLPRARLWWPRGHGAATTLPLRVDVRRGADASALTQRVGLRTVALDTVGGAFAFVVNGRRVFARGANAVPLAPFYPVDDAVAARVLGAAADANMNMVRVWGGGVFESDRYYDLADSLGLMVWQDFPFASAFYPGDDAFVATVEAEAEAAVRRLRRHPSVVLWCGGNEVWEGWTNWGWQRSLGYSAADSARVGAAYGRIFEDALGGVVRRDGAGVPYWANSPSTGWGREAAYRRGDVHYWGVWWGREPFERYRERVGRFHSEYGMQGYPVWATVRDFAGGRSSGVLSEDDATFASHQKHPTGFATLREYARQTFLPDTLALDRLRRDDLPAYAFVTQAMQAEGIGLAASAHRAGAPRTMGTLVWQLNDVWPVVSWSSVDVYGRWKPLHHRLAALYRPLFADLVPEPNDGKRGERHRPRRRPQRLGGDGPRRRARARPRVGRLRQPQRRPRRIGRGAADGASERRPHCRSRRAPGRYAPLRPPRAPPPARAGHLPRPPRRPRHRRRPVAPRRPARRADHPPDPGHRRPLARRLLRRPRRRRLARSADGRDAAPQLPRPLARRARPRGLPAGRGAVVRDRSQRDRAARAVAASRSEAPGGEGRARRPPRRYLEALPRRSSRCPAPPPVSPPSSCSSPL